MAPTKRRTQRHPAKAAKKRPARRGKAAPARAEPRKRPARRAKPAPSPAERTAPLGDVLPDDALAFSVTWSELNEPAALAELRYNDALVTEPRVAAPGKVTVAFQRPISGVHRFSWDLFFPGRKLRNLDAGAALNGAARRSLGKAKDAADHWADRGEL